MSSFCHKSILHFLPVFWSFFVHIFWNCCYWCCVCRWSGKDVFNLWFKTTFSSSAHDKFENIIQVQNMCENEVNIERSGNLTQDCPRLSRDTDPDTSFATFSVQCTSCVQCIRVWCATKILLCERSLEKKLTTMFQWNEERNSFFLTLFVVNEIKSSTIKTERKLPLEKRDKCKVSENSLQMRVSICWRKKQICQTTMMYRSTNPTLFFLFWRDMRRLVAQIMCYFLHLCYRTFNLMCDLMEKACTSNHGSRNPRTTYPKFFRKPSICTMSWHWENVSKNGTRTPQLRATSALQFWSNVVRIGRFKKKLHDDNHIKNI